MQLFIINAIFWLIICLTLWKKCKQKEMYRVGLIISILYLLSASSSVILLIIDKSYLKESSNLTISISLLYLNFLLAPFIYTISSLPITKKTTLVIPNTKLFDFVCHLTTLASIISLIYQTPYAFKGLTAIDINELRSQISSTGLTLLPKSIWTSISATISFFFIWQIILFFISYLQYGWKKKTIIIFISTFSYVSYSFANLGRDGVIYWIFAFAILYNIFTSYIPPNKKNTLKWATLLSSTPITLLFLLITKNRFVNYGGISIAENFIRYLGQPAINFVNFFNYDFPSKWGGKSFSLLTKGDNQLEFNAYISQKGIDIYVFSTFIGSWKYDFGFWGTITFVFLTVIIAIYCLNRRSIINANSLNLLALFYYASFAYAFSIGLFYFKLYGSYGNFFILVVTFLAIMDRNRLFGNYRSHKIQRYE